MVSLTLRARDRSSIRAFTIWLILSDPSTTPQVNPLAAVITVKAKNRPAQRDHAADALETTRKASHAVGVIVKIRLRASAERLEVETEELEPLTNRTLLRTKILLRKLNSNPSRTTTLLEAVLGPKAERVPWPCRAWFKARRTREPGWLPESPVSKSSAP